MCMFSIFIIIVIKNEKNVVKRNRNSSNCAHDHITNDNNKYFAVYALYANMLPFVVFAVFAVFAFDHDDDDDEQSYNVLVSA